MADEIKKSKPQEIELDCPAKNAGCSEEKCKFQNWMEITTDGTIIKKITVKWQKTSTSQCCKASRENGKGMVGLTYADGSSKQITSNEYTNQGGKNAFPPGLNWLNPEGDEVDKAPPPADPSGFTFDHDRAKQGLTVIFVQYEMAISCKCDEKPGPVKKDWKTEMRYRAGDKEITLKP